MYAVLTFIGATLARLGGRIAWGATPYEEWERVTLGPLSLYTSDCCVLDRSTQRLSIGPVTIGAVIGEDR